MKKLFLAAILGFILIFTQPGLAISDDKIIEGDTAVEVVDTGNGHILFVEDGYEKARITGGQFAIGTASPDGIFHAKHSINPVLRVTDTTVPTTAAIYATDTKGWMGTITNHPLSILTNDITRMSIATNGEIAIENAFSLKEMSAPSATAGYGKVYVKATDSLLYFKDDGGTEYDLTSGSALAVLKASELNDTSDPHLLIASELKNTILTNVESIGVDEWDFPARTEGWNFIFIKEANQNITLDPYGSENWYVRINDLAYVLNGAGRSIVNTTNGRSTVTCFSTESAVYCTGDFGWETGS